MTPTWFRAASSRSRRTPKHRGASQARLRLEGLEDRTLLSNSIPLNSVGWTTIGPSSINAGELFSGRIAALAGDPTNASIIYIAAADGGVWKTTDAGNSWRPLTDNQATLNMGAIAIAPSNPNVIYAGTGEANMGPSKAVISRFNIYYGRGVLKSTDGGNSWTLLGNSVFDRRAISKIQIDPTNPNIAYVAVGYQPVNGLPGNTGIWKTTDGGTTWTNTTVSISTSAAFSDLAMDPTNGQVLYAAVGDPNGNTVNGIYKTSDAGAHWAFAGNFPGGGSDRNVGRIAVALSKAAPQTLYVTIAQSGPTASLYKELKSTDGGVTWRQLPSPPNYLGSFGDYDITLAVDPSNSNIVYGGGTINGGVDMVQSADGGNTWADITGGANGVSLHGDEHGIGFDAAGRLLAGNDGGIWRLDDATPGSPRWSDINSNLNITQFEGIAQDPTTPNLAYGGSQDNGVETFADNPVWTIVEGGDGGYMGIDNNNPRTVYHDAAVGSYGPLDFVRRSDDGGQTWVSKTDGLNAANEPTIFYPPMIVDPSNPNRLLLGTSRVYETTNRADLWTPISTPGSAGWTATGAITSMAISPSDPNTIYASADGKVFVTTNHGQTWAERDPVPGAPAGLQFRDMRVDPTDAQTAYVTAFNFGDVTGGGHVWRTTNAGATWNNISSNLPDLPVRSIALNPNGPGTQDDVVYIGTDAGIYFTANLGQSWSKLDSGLPNVMVQTLDFAPNLGVLAAGTNGRGMWEITTTHFRITPLVNPVTAGSPFSVIVAALDPAGNIIPNFQGTVHFASSDVAAGLPADYTFTPSDNGSHVFTGLVLQTVGTQTILASDPVVSAAVGSIPITVDPIPATKVHLTTPATVSAGATFSITVTALDGSGAVAPDYRGTVHFTTTDSGIGVSLPTDYTFTAADQGVHTFGGLRLVTAGNEQLTVADTSGAATADAATIMVLPGAASNLSLTTPINTPSGSTFGVTVTALDAFGNLATGYAGTVHFSSSDGSASLPADFAFSAADAGVHTFAGVVLRQMGSQTVSVIDVANGALAGSAVVNVTAAPAQFRVTAPGAVVAGTSFSFTVTALDGAGNTVTGYTGTVRLSSSDATALLPADYAFSATDHGVHTFVGNIFLTRAGIQSVAATDRANGALTGSAVITVRPAVAVQYRLLGPAISTASVPFSVTLTVLDSFGNIATGYTGTVRFSSTDASAVLPGAYTFMTGDQGVHTFTGLVLRSTGDQTIAAADSANAGISGAADVTVQPGASRLSLTLPTTATAGVPFNITLMALDASGVLVTGYSGTVHFSGTDALGMLPADYTFTAADAGAHTFTGVMLRLAGSQRVSVADAAAGSITGSGAVMVNAAAAARLSVTAPLSEPSRAGFSVTVTALDAFGNQATSYRGRVHITSSDGQATLPTDYTFTALDGGVHVFSGVILRNPGSRSMTVTDTTTATISGSAAVTVLPTAFMATGADAGGGPEVKVYDALTGQLKFDFFAYNVAFTGGVRVAVGDVTGDGIPDIITAPGPGGGPDVRVWDGVTGQMVQEFLAYAPQFTGGINVAAGDTNGDGIADIITGADAGGGPHVQIFNGTNHAVLASFFPYAVTFTGGVRVAAGDVDGDGKADVITAPGIGGGPDVRVFNGAGALIREIIAYNPGFTGGVYVAAGDVDGDGKADIITGAGFGGGPHVEVFSGATGVRIQSFFAYNQSFTGGVRVGAVDITNDGKADILTAAGPGGGPHVKAYDGASLALLDSFFAYDSRFPGGVFIGGH